MTHPTKTIIEAQKQGLPLPGTPDVETKVEFQLKTSAGRLVMTFDNEERAREWAGARFTTHKHKVSSVHLFKVTTITEQL